ncbi:DNA polymerase III subunit chi [Methylibium sp.]|uniref:DNA polymerase III subunit chi n=1 Tax=Methylibium sp. TaxID=2067992 RepID=UPI003D13F8F5
MTEVNFHHGAADPLAHACRLLAKACQRGARVAVTASAERLAQLDVMLWTYDPLAFVPHARLRQGETMPARLTPTPIWLLDRAGDAPHHEVLVNLGPDVTAGFESFERLFEIVGNGDDERRCGRQRWRYLESRGYEIRPHEVRG